MAKLDEKYNYKKIRTDRASGILMHITSLPGSYGIGSLGKNARSFANFLKDAGQKYWQILPIGPTGYGDSPYQSFSAYAGNPYLIDLDTLKDEGLLTEKELKELEEVAYTDKVDYGRIYTERYNILRSAHARSDKDDLDYLSFVNENSFWLNDYALFMTLKGAEGGKQWSLWPDEFKRRDKDALARFIEENAIEYDFYKFVQYEFYKQWKDFREYVHGLGIKLIGDIPIYVAEDSADCWAHPKLFKMKDDLTLEFVGGCPPDDFSDDGQLWGNPVYNWQEHEKDNFDWWVERIKWNFKVFDSIRIDHFRGFESFWQIPFGDTTARGGEWVLGPGTKLFDRIKEELGDLPIIAEDLGYMTEEVYAFRQHTGFPGMKILQFAFNPEAKSDYLPHNIEVNSVIYTGTHDNDTIMGWHNSAPMQEVDFAKRYFNITSEEGFNWGMFRGAETSVAKLCILQMQDFFALDNSSRMNSPGKLGDNWTWRMKNFDGLESIAIRLRELSRMSGRV